MKTRRLATAWAAAGLVLMLGTASAAAEGQFQITRFSSPFKAKQFLETVDWERYDATSINIAQERGWGDKALYFDLRDDEWKVLFPNDKFLLKTRQHYGDLANPKPVKGDLQKAAFKLMGKGKMHVYRVWTGGDEGTPTAAIVVTPYTVEASHNATTILFRLDEDGLDAREGEDEVHDLSFLDRGKLGGLARGLPKEGEEAPKAGGGKMRGIKEVPDSGSK